MGTCNVLRDARLLVHLVMQFSNNFQNFFGRGNDNREHMRFAFLRTTPGSSQADAHYDIVCWSSVGWAWPTQYDAYQPAITG